MRVLRAIGVTLLVFVGLLVGAFYILANHSVTRIALTCTGTWAAGEPGVQGRAEWVNAVIEVYRPWIVWGDSDGNLRAESREMPMAVYFHHMRRIGDEPMITYQFRQDSDGPMIGGYRGSFRELTLQFVGGTVFDGVCT
ncbi:MAG TPA: hypothetical protein VGN60_01460 [Devosia sp.]|jgi:hypothetical protein|nr:hypothetical protein [Devosia sp.]